MKALSIRQPWAWLIVNGHKDIENRTWPTRFRGRVLIHAGKGMTRAEYDDALATALHVGYREYFPTRDQLQRGGIVGIATMTECIEPASRTSPWHMNGQFGFQLAYAKPIPFVECKGMLGFFDVPTDIATQLRQMYELGAIA
ncbi:ASCH domain-containing protein [Paraburkholderia eburnea]|uniref:ASCH domain-containing protein n=1 Tax=Paraburkholderia eburnea TaxID=1189126 RepID=A0A2S4MDH5_9BURK|nr:ASCH domain-containing protein [Paraburkholderia eburnea]POR52810.1 ASCH domain-containing protein [Paraburkholderia eburnea]PRZ23678.1 ASCH domain-containing protein [Paraburkholderia eburnea]